MPSSPDDRPTRDPLEAVLRDVEAKLKARLHEACEAEASGVTTESTSEIRRLEDSLLAAAVAAEQTIALRRHLERRRSSTAARASDAMTNKSGDTPVTEPAVVKIREFRDSAGQLWRAWPVTPGQARPGRTAERYLGEFHNGWICFEALGSSARRRLPRQPERWTELQDSELVQLLDQAISAPERKRRADAGGDPTTPPLQ
jgi:hypothetical protein